MTALPTCCITGRIAGDPYACGDCDPCGADHAVPDAVKNLIKERDKWADDAAGAMEEAQELRASINHILEFVGDENSRLTALARLADIKAIATRAVGERS